MQLTWCTKVIFLQLIYKRNHRRLRRHVSSNNCNLVAIHIDIDIDICNRYISSQFLTKSPCIIDKIQYGTNYVDYSKKKIDSCTNMTRIQVQ